MNARKVLSLIIVLVATLTFVTAPKARAQDAGDIAIFVEAVGTDQKIGSAGGSITHNWDTLERNDESAYGYTLGNGAINLSEGHYMVMYNSLFERDGGGNRSLVESELVLGGSSLANGRSAGYIRRSSGADETVVAGGGIINVAAGGEALSLKSTRTDGNGNGAVRLQAGSHTAIQLLKLDDSWDYLSLTKTTGSQTAPTSNGPGTVTKVNYNLEDPLQDGGTSMTNLGGGDIQLNDIGHYMVFANTGFSVGGATTVVQQLNVGGSVIDGSLTTAFMRTNESTNDSSSSIGTIIETTSVNQLLNVEIWRDQGGTATIKNNVTALTIVKLPDAGEFVRLNDSTGALMTNPHFSPGI